ncbi:hypothetical protein TH61_01845 [Rufibacter sp. DG15C]|uniref:DUF4279 domain-containing protein n=1 Tax=Rufibacter sp. DG15C TaxID=1379909 RepID=UPI00078E247D|nr:DUF4279 domain-containing protein [Rufibacter sp. DG15C]AMM50165.1 hypothetical protein TH61_01845 [Rufibacter sp. DG15C]
MSEEEIILLATQELQNPTLGVTEQYLEIHQPVTIEGKIRIDRVDAEGASGLAIVYIPVDGEYFHFAVNVDLKEKCVTNVEMESFNRVRFKATSEQFTLDELKAFTTLSPTQGWSKGDLSKSGNVPYKFSSIEFMPNPEPDEFEDKLRNLLDFLEQDKDGVGALVERANGWISVAMDFHNGNGMLGGMNIDSTSIKRMEMLNLSIDFDLYASGNAFKE